MDVTSGEMIAGLISIVLTLFFFVALARIESSTKETAMRLKLVTDELQGVNAKLHAIARDGLRVHMPEALPLEKPRPTTLG